MTSFLPPPVYSWHPETGLYVGRGWADPSPLEPKVWLIPAHATLVAPPDIPDTHVARWSNGQWTLELKPPPPDPETPPSVPTRVISNRQFFQQLAIAGLITRQEALAAVKTGEVPEALATLLDNIPPDPRFNAEMLLSGATQFDRYHPLVAPIGAAQGMTDEEIDQFWIAAGQL